MMLCSHVDDKHSKALQSLSFATAVYVLKPCKLCLLQCFVADSFLGQNHDDIEQSLDPFLCYFSGKSVLSCCMLCHVAGQAIW